MKKRKLNLQMFAEEISGNADMAGSQLATGTETAGSQLATGEAASQTMSFDEMIKSSPDYKKEFDSRMQKAIKGRIKETKELQGRMDKIRPVMELFGQRYGIDASDLSDDVLEQITGKIMEDNSFYEEEAMKMGMDVETYKMMQQTQRENAELRRFRQQTEANLENQKRFFSINREAEELKNTYPGFDLDVEMSNPTFQRLVWNSGVPLKTAYEVIHHDEILTAAAQVTATKTAEKISDTIRAGMYRAQENGVSDQSAYQIQNKSPKNWTKEERDAIRERVKNGERVVF